MVPPVIVMVRQGAEKAIRPPACRENLADPGKGIAPPGGNRKRMRFPRPGATLPPRPVQPAPTAGQRPTRRGRSARLGAGRRWPGALGPRRARDQRGAVAGAMAPARRRYALVLRQGSRCRNQCGHCRPRTHHHPAQGAHQSLRPRASPLYRAFHVAGHLAWASSPHHPSAAAGIVATRPTTVLMLPASGFAAMAARTAEAWRWLALLSVAAFPWQDGAIRCVGHIICAPLPGQKHSAMMAWQCRPGPASVRPHGHPPAFRASRRVWCGCALALNTQSQGRGRPHPGHPSPAIESGGVSPKEMFSVLGNLGGIQGGTLRRRSAGLKPVVAAGTGSAPFMGARNAQPVAPVPRVAPRPRSCP